MNYNWLFDGPIIYNKTNNMEDYIEDVEYCAKCEKEVEHYLINHCSYCGEHFCDDHFNIVEGICNHCSSFIDNDIDNE